MKRIFIILVSIIGMISCHSATAQNTNRVQEDVYLVPDPETARWSYIETDANGKQISTDYYSIESMEGDAINGIIRLRVDEVPVASPGDTVKNSVFYRFKDGEYLVDMKAVFEHDVLASLVSDAINEADADISEEQKTEAINQTKSKFKITGEIRGIPRYPEVGKLPDYEFKCKVSILSMKVSGKDRSIAGTETIQTEAGTFDCFILDETITTKVMVMKAVEKTRSWYAYNIGLVKEIRYDKDGNVISTMVLNGINW